MDRLFGLGHLGTIGRQGVVVQRSAGGGVAKPVHAPGPLEAHEHPLDPGQQVKGQKGKAGAEAHGHHPAFGPESGIDRQHQRRHQVPGEYSFAWAITFLNLSS